jgi:flagellar hook assembly protein FlgD
VRVAKLFAGDIDNDNYGDLVFTSSSFASDKPHIYFIEHDGSSDMASDGQNTMKPEAFSLRQNYPNPFNPETQFSYKLPSSGMVHLAIYDLLGREIYTVIDGYQRAGNHNVLWTGVDNHGISMHSGVYFYVLISGSKTITKKLVLTK